MHTARRHFRLGLRLALVAIWALALLPTLSHALARADAATLGVICTPQGPKQAPGDATSAASALQHCALCALAADAPPLLPAAPALQMPAAAAAFEPLLFLQAPRTLHAWAAAQPRAPPAASETA
jgi:hypothetical protein